MPAKNDSPLEDVEQIRVVRWCEDRGLKLTAIPNSTYTKSWSQKNHNHAVGLRAGFPDLVILVAPNQSHDGRGYLLAVEMKRRKGYTVSTMQREWIAAINGLGCNHVESVVAHGADEAIEYLTGYLSPSVVNATARF